MPLMLLNPSLKADNGIFQRSYSFKCSGSFAVEFDNSDQETIKILFVRENVVASVDSSGIITGIEKVVDDAPLIDRLHSIRRTIGNSQYTLRNDMGILNLFAMSHSQLVVESANGEEQIIYDASSAHIRNMIAAVICIVAFVTVVTVGVIREFIKARRRFNIAEQTV